MSKTPILNLCRFNESTSLYPALKALLERKDIDLALRDNMGRNSLFLLTRYYPLDDLIDCIQLLIESGVEANTKDNNSKLACEILARHYNGPNFMDIFRLLVNNDTNMKALQLCIGILQAKTNRFQEAEELNNYLTSLRVCFSRSLF